MTNPIDFPANPLSGQTYTAPSGVQYTFDGYGWTISIFAAPTYQLSTVADILWQVRVLLQDTDLSSGNYRYADAEIVTNLNQGMSDLFRIRPDLFLEQAFVIPVFNNLSLTTQIGIEEQYISPLIFYVVALTQARDDEQTQDARAGVFFKTFQQQVVLGVLT
jgi:hypothetical protein